MKIRLIMAMVAGLICLLGMNTILYADGGEEMPPPRSLPKYNGAVQVVETDQTLLLTKDDIGMVQKFFESKSQSGDRIESIPEEGAQAFRMSFYKNIQGREQSLQLLEAVEKTPSDNMHPALGELKGQVVMGKHSEAEYQVLANKYKALHLAYFRQVSDDRGGTVSEGEKIYRKAYNQVHGKNKAAQNGSSDQAQKAQADDLKKQMQAMKAKGDIAGIMNLAQKSSTSPRQTKAGAAAMDEMNKDTWDIWVQCLHDIEAVAYRTQLQYAADPLP